MIRCDLSFYIILVSSLALYHPSYHPSYRPSYLPLYALFFWLRTKWLYFCGYFTWFNLIRSCFVNLIIKFPTPNIIFLYTLNLFNIHGIKMLLQWLILYPSLHPSLGSYHPSSYALGMIRPSGRIQGWIQNHPCNNINLSHGY